MEWRARRAIHRYLILLLFWTLITILGTNAYAAWAPGRFEIYLFDVGQADSQLIVSPTGKTLLIDAGETTWNSSSNADAIAAKIRQVMGTGFSHLDYILATHLHSDHIGAAGHGNVNGYGGIWKLIERHNFTVGKLIDRDSGVWMDSNADGVCDPDSEIIWRNVGTRSATGDRWLCYATDPGNVSRLNRETALVGSTSQIDLGQGVTVKIIQGDAKNVMMSDHVTPVQGDHSGDSLPPSENDYSITLKVTYGLLDYVAGGDTDGEYAVSQYGYTYNDVETVIAPDIGRVDVMKANHHGSSHSSNPSYIGTLRPTVSLISCGANTYGHPDQTVLNRLLSNGKVYITGTCDTTRNYGTSVIANGEIVVSTSDGVNYTVNGDSYVASNPPLPDTTAPTVTSFRVLVTQATFSTHVVKVRSFTATDPGGSVTGYKITESSSRPDSNSRGWTIQKPKTYKIRSTRTRALYGWAKDSAGNVSEGRQAEVWFEE